MKQIIIDKALVSDIQKLSARYDKFCATLDCSLVQLHTNSKLYTCVKDNGTSPCRIYIGNCKEIIKRCRSTQQEKMWIEANIIDGQLVAEYFETDENEIRQGTVIVGGKVATIDASHCKALSRSSNSSNRVIFVHSEKTYSEEDHNEFQKRSVINLSTLNSYGIDIIYFDGAPKLIEKLLYGGCSSLTVYIHPSFNQEQALRELRALSDRAPFTNDIVCVLDEHYTPKAEARLVIGEAKRMPTKHRTPSLSFGISQEAGDVNAYVGINTMEHLILDEEVAIKPSAMHYITSIMAEIVLHAVSKSDFALKRLYKINARSLNSETIIKEN